MKPLASTAPPPLTITWEPINWFSATWRQLTPLVRPEPRHFDIISARGDLEKLIVNWPSAPFDLSISEAEAIFWFSSCFGKGLGDFSMLDELTATLNNGSGKIDLSTMKALLKKTRFAPERAHGLVPIQILGTLMKEEDLIELFCESPLMVSVQIQFRKNILPFLTTERKISLHALVQKYLCAPFETNLSFAHYLAACLGMHQPTLELVENWSDTYLERADMHGRNLPLIVFGLGSPELVATHFKRLNMKLTDRDHVVSWIAHTEDNELDTVIRSVRRAAFNINTDDMMRVLCCLSSLKTAEVIADLYIGDPVLKTIAADWLQAHPDLAVEALIYLSCHQGVKADSALGQLRVMQRHLGQSKIREIAMTMPPNAVRRLKEELLEPHGNDLSVFDTATTPDWLALGIAGQIKKSEKKNKFPAWLHVQDMTPIVVGEHRLNDSQVETVLSALQESTLDEPADLIIKLKKHASADSLDRFAWLLLDIWLRNEGKAKENWAMFAVGLLGSDALAPKLARLIREWPGESNHKRAVVGLDCLRVMGSDIALMQINGIAEKVQFKGLKGKADECMAAIAAAKNMSQERLSDRIIPTLGFERSGEQIFDYGDRHFIVRLGGDLRPIIYDQSGKVRADLPAATAGDEADLANKSLANFKALKKSLKDLQKIQTIRLEHAMVLGRRWFTDEFVNFLNNHPVMHYLLRDYVFCGYNMTGQIKYTFAIYDREDIKDIDGLPVDLSSFTEIGLLHPLQLSSDELAKWKTVFESRKIKQPFAQLERPLYKLKDNEENDFAIMRLANLRIAAVTIVGTLDRHGWQRGPVMDGGVYTEHVKHFPRQDITAIVQYQGIPTGTGGVDWEDQYIDNCLFLPGKVAGDYGRDFQKGIQLGSVDPVVLSEVLTDVELLKAKGVRE